MKSRSLKTVATLATTAMLLGAFYAVPAEAKKKKKKKKPPAPVVEACPAYTPTEWGADAETIVLTDEATAEAPVALQLSVPAGAGFTSTSGPEEGEGMASHAFVNVQVDTALESAGLYATVTHMPAWDYDLSIRGDDGASIAYSAGVPGVSQFDGDGGHTGVGTENIVGLHTPDCTGYLVDIAGAITPGGTVDLTLWLGETQYTPGE